MKFLKENSYDVVRLFINQVGITIFALVLYTAVGFVEDAQLSRSIKVALSLFATLFYFVLIYTVSWEYGAKDKVRIDTGKLKDDRFKGVKYGLFANLINIILALVSVITLGSYMISGSDGMFTVFGIVNMFMRFIMAMYIGMLQGVFAAWNSTETQNLYFLGQSIGYIVFPFIAAGVVVFGYGMGKRNKRIFPSSKPTVIK